jgi:hypothetical protein
MKLISTKTHGVLDYLMSILLIISPWLFDFNNNSPAQALPITLGIVMFVMSFCTDYELGGVKIIRMRTHLIVDVITGLLLAFSPWLLNFSEEVYLPHLILGLAEVGAAMITDRVPYRKPTVPAK